MSLIHWWPLNGDLQDKIQGKVLSTSTWTSSTGGKIGNCYNMNIGGTATCSNIYLPSTFTMTCWIKNNDLTYPQSPCAMKLSNGSPYKTTAADKGWEFCHGGTLSFTTNDGTAPKAKFLNYNPSSLIGTWYHLALVSDFINKVAYIYVNGSLVTSATITSGDWGGTYTFTVGQLYGWKIDGLMNDLRLYDHALSAAEVKELSKALVIHYTFDDILTESTTNVSTINGWSSYTSYFVISERTETGLKVYRPTNSTNTVLALSNSAVTGKMAAGEIWTFSCFLYVDGKPYKCTQPDMSTYKYSGISYYSNDDGYYTCTFTVGAPEPWIIHASIFGSVDTNVMCEIDKIQFEKKDHATPYTPNSRNGMLCNETGLNQPTSTKNIKLSTDTCSGIYSLDCSTSQVTTVLDLTGHSNATAAAWIKINDYGTNDCSCVLIGGIYLVVGKTGRLGAYAYGKTNPGYHYSPSNVTVPLNTWTHIANVWDGTTVKGYINGQLAYSASCSGSFSGGTANKFVGLENASGRPFNGKIAEVRLYTTPLSANDIAELYKTKAYITDKSDIEAHQFVEDKSQAQVTSKYCFEADEFYEELYSGYDVLEYLESTGTQYVDTGYVTTSTDYTYELDMAPTKIGGFYSYMGFMASGTTPRAGIHEYSSVFMIGANATTNSSTKPVVNERVVLKGHFKSGAQKLYKNDILIASNSTSFNHSANTLSTHIFGRNYSSGRNLTSIKLYSAKIYEGSTLVRHYIPVRRQSDNALGLYDIVTNTFCANSGSGTFKNGPARTNKSASIYEDMHVSGREIIEI